MYLLLSCFHLQTRLARPFYREAHLIRGTASKGKRPIPKLPWDLQLIMFKFLFYLTEYIQAVHWEKHPPQCRQIMRVWARSVSESGEVQKRKTRPLRDKFNNVRLLTTSTETIWKWQNTCHLIDTETDLITCLWLDGYATHHIEFVVFCL